MTHASGRRAAIAEDLCVRVGMGQARRLGARLRDENLPHSTFGPNFSISPP